MSSGVSGRRLGRFFAVPLVVLGFAAIAFLLNGGRDSKDPAAFWEHLRANGYTVHEAPPIEQIDFGYAEFVGEGFSAEVDGIYVELRRMESVVQAMTSYRAELGSAAGASTMADLMSTTEPSKRLYRNENFLLSIGSSDGERVRAIGELFERWVN